MDTVYLLKILNCFVDNDTFSDVELISIDQYLFHGGDLPKITKNDSYRQYTGDTFEDTLIYLKDRFVLEEACWSAFEIWKQIVKSKNQVFDWVTKMIRSVDSE